MREGPDMQAHHQCRRTFLGRQSGAEGLHRLAQHCKGCIGGLAQLRVVVERYAGFEHRRVIGGLVTGKGEVGPPDALEGCEGIRPPVTPGTFEMRREQLEAAQCDIGDQRVAVAEMTIRRGGAGPRRAGSLGKRKTGRPLASAQIEGRLDQRLAQIAVMIAAALPRSVSRPPHVNDYNIVASANRTGDLAIVKRGCVGSLETQLAMRSQPYKFEALCVWLPVDQNEVRL